MKMIDMLFENIYNRICKAVRQLYK